MQKFTHDQIQTIKERANRLLKESNDNDLHSLMIQQLLYIISQYEKELGDKNV